ncbi:MAG TPA: hypothetical protein VF168_11730 [Trueperaceae bacterium]
MQSGYHLVAESMRSQGSGFSQAQSQFLSADPHCTWELESAAYQKPNAQSWSTCFANRSGEILGQVRIGGHEDERRQLLTPQRQCPQMNLIRKGVLKEVAGQCLVYRLGQLVPECDGVRCFRWSYRQPGYRAVPLQSLYEERCPEILAPEQDQRPIRRRT